MRTTLQQAFLDCKLHVGGLARHTRWEQCLQQVVSDWELHMGGTSEQGTSGGNDRCGKLVQTRGSECGGLPGNTRQE